MERYAGCYLAHNLMLIAYGSYWRRKPSLKAYGELIAWLMTHPLSSAVPPGGF